VPHHRQHGGHDDGRACRRQRDAEEAADFAAERLLSQGVFRLDGVVLTHFDMDHSGGMKYLLSRIPADTLFVPECTDENGVRNALAPLVNQVIDLRTNVILTYGDTELSIFGPVVPDSGNESSLAVLFRHEDCDILITGDRSSFGERILLKTADIPQVDILVAGHHGSKNSTGNELLQAVMPKIAVISVGQNHFGHPAQEVLDRLAAIGCAVYRTDLHGNIVFRR
jgi:competence protein ComEC